MNSALISAIDLEKRLGDRNCIVVDCRFNLMQPDAGREAWREGHVPGAHYADLDRDLAAPARGPGGRHPLPDPAALARRFAAWGITADSEVTCYDDAGGAVAARLWWLLRWMGHERVRVLDGGLAAWVDAVFLLDTTEPPVAQGGFEARPGSMPIMDVSTVAEGLSAGHLVLLDARDADRFAGRSEPIDPVAGHVPGAVNFPLQRNLEDGRFRGAAELREQFLSVIGNRAIDKVACMCGSGVTACHLLLALEEAGLPGASLYVGSWSDWISDPGRAIETET